MAQNNIIIGDGFHVTAAKPLDDRTVVDSLKDLELVHNPYEGMICSVKEKRALFYYHPDSGFFEISNYHTYAVCFPIDANQAIETNVNGKISIVKIALNNVQSAFLSYNGLRVEITNPLVEPIVIPDNTDMLWEIQKISGAMPASITVKFDNIKE